MKIIEKLKKINIKKKKTRFFSSFIGTILYATGGVTSMSLGHYSVYITSYFHHKQVKIDMNYGNLVMPIIIFSNSIFSPIAGYIDNKIGLYYSLLLSFILLELGLLLFINQNNIWLSIILIIFLGFSNGIGMTIPGKNLLLYYPKKGGIIGSTLGSCFLLLGTIFGVFGEKIINPGKYTLKKGEQFYPLEISQNYLKYYKFIIYINPFVLVLSLLLIKKYDPIYDEELVQEDIIFSDNKSNKILLKKDGNYLKNIKSAIINKRIWRMVGITNLTLFVYNFSKNTFRVFGALASVSGAIMQYSLIFTMFISILVGPIWGYINDKYKYELIIKALCICLIIQALFFSIFIKSNTVYIIFIIFGSIIGTGFISASSLHILKVYGIKYNIEIKGIINIFSSIFNILNTSISLIISKFFHTGDELKFAYRYIYLSGFFICGIGTYLAFYEKDDQFIYPFSQNQNDFLSMINSDNKEKGNIEKIINENKEIELELESNTSDITLDSN